VDPLPRALPRAPADALGPTGPRFGAYAGSLGRVDLSALAPEGLLASVRHAARLKRWQRVVLVGPAHLVVATILDGGAVAGGSVWVVDRASGEVRWDRSATGLSGLNARVGERPGAGARASFAGPGFSLTLERRSDRYQLEADLGEALGLEALLDARGAPDPFALVAPLPEDGVRATQVSGPLALSGVLRLRGERHALDGGLAALDYGAGLFPREVAWRKVTAAGRLADGRPVALHLAEGLDGAEPDDGGEDVLLLGPGPQRLPPVAVQADAQSAAATWRLVSGDGAVDLTFHPAASHREGRELLLVSTAITQLAGTLSGRLPGPQGEPLVLDGLPAVAEDLAARW
jgi:hypothetical protein